MADDDKNPLDVLEELLSKNSGDDGAQVPAAGKPKGGKPVADPNKPVEKTEEELAKELEQKRADFEEMEGKAEVVDEQKLVEQREAIMTIKDSQEYQNRIEQNTEKKQDEDKKAKAGEGFEIEQLDHTKV